MMVGRKAGTKVPLEEHPTPGRKAIPPHHRVLSSLPTVNTLIDPEEDAEDHHRWTPWVSLYPL